MSDSLGFFGQESQIEIMKITKTKPPIPFALLEFVPPNLVDFPSIFATTPPELTFNRINRIVNCLWK